MRKPDTTTKSSLTIALVMHGVAFLIFFVWAAKTGRLDPILRAINVVQVAKEKPKEQQKQPEPDTTPKIQDPAKAPPPVASTPAPIAQKMSPPPPDFAPTVAPPPAAAAAFFFDDGAKQVESTTNAPVAFYKNLVEYSIRSHWDKPSDATDFQYLAEAEIYIDSMGRIKRYAWLKGSGDPKWDESVKKALGATSKIDRPPPVGFPEKFIVRFDVVAESESIIQ